MRMQKMLVLALLLVLGCAGTSSMSTQARERLITANYQATFDAVTAYLTQRGFAISTADRAMGLIETDYRAGAGWGTTFTGDKRARVRAVVANAGEKATKLTLDLISEERDPSAGWQQVSMDMGQENNIYKRFLDAIEALALGETIR